MKTQRMKRYPAAVDLTGHPMETTIKQVMKLGIKGLQPNPAHKFFPDQKITRAEFAMMVQNILMKVTQDRRMATRFIGQASPFPDVSKSVWYYNAARTVVVRGLMQVGNPVTGEFQPMGTVSGADALLTVRTMKQVLKKYIRY